MKASPWWKFHQIIGKARPARKNSLCSHATVVECVSGSKDTKELTLRNVTLLPVTWRLTGLENLGDDFSVSQEAGVIQPKTDFVLSVFFRALKPINVNRKNIRIEVRHIVSLYCEIDCNNN